MRDRRRAPRRSWNGQVRALCDGGAVEVQAADLSATGITLCGPAPRIAALRGSAGPVLLQLELPGEADPHLVFAEARRHAAGVTHARAALDFVLLPQESRARLDRFVRAAAVY